MNRCEELRQVLVLGMLDAIDGQPGSYANGETQEWYQHGRVLGQMFRDWRRGALTQNQVVLELSVLAGGGPPVVGTAKV